ncbi:HTH-type sugar sensing transcriptional regulator TrmBL1 [uncultured archaeon]|nr:HTH-type sugar sensing transcriptional regulator TrmBL1 [uncultured archaeon]
MEEQIINIFETIGLSRNETKIYLELLKNNNLSALELSKRTFVHRSNTYDSIRKLKDKGFVSEIIDKKKRLFIALPPERIKSYLKQKEYDIDSILPSLNNITKDCSTENRVEIINGTFSIRERLQDFLKSGLNINVYGASKEAVENFGEGFLKDFHKERMKKKILMRHIYDESAIERVRYLNKKAYTEARIIPKKYYTNSSITMCGDSVLIVVFNSPVYGIFIKNKDISNTYNKYFELLWREAKVTTN